LNSVVLINANDALSESPKPISSSTPPLSTSTTSKIMNDERVLRTIRFLRMRASNRPETEDWRAICRSDIVYSAPGIFREMRDCFGIEALIEESVHRNIMIGKAICSRGADQAQSTWIIDFDLLPEDVILGSTEEYLSLSYDFKVFEVPLLPSGGLTSQSYWTPIWNTHVYSKISFSVLSGDSEKIASIHEQFDVTDLLTQTRRFMGLPVSDLTFHPPSHTSYELSS